MAPPSKQHLWNSLKAEGVTFDDHYRTYSVAKLQELWDEQGLPLPPEPPKQTKPPQQQPAIDMAAAADAAELEELRRYKQEMDRRMAAVGQPTIPSGPVYSNRADPSELPGQRLNSQPENSVIRVDEQGRQWYQEEILKPGQARPRGRRVIKYVDRGVKTETATSNGYTETFEVEGDQYIPSEVKVTLPSYQVGVYKDPRFPFKINTYQGKQGFDFDDVAEFFGGADLVPTDVKRTYVSSVLSYDIRTTVRAIEDAYRRLQLETSKKGY